MSVIPKTSSKKYVAIHQQFLEKLPKVIGTGIFKAKLVELDGFVALRGFDKEEDEEFFSFRYRGPYKFLYAGYVTLPSENMSSAIDMAISSVKQSIEDAREEFLLMYSRHSEEVSAENMVSTIGVKPDTLNIGCGYPLYYLELLKSEFESCEKLSDGLWALVSRKEDHWVKVVFVEGEEESEDESLTLVSHFFTSEGTGQALRECRHTRFGNELDGYVFYMNFERMNIAIDFLRGFFDG